MKETNKARASRFGISESYYYRLKREGVDVTNDDELSAAIVSPVQGGDAQRLLKARADRAEAAAEKERLMVDVEREKYVTAESVYNDSLRLGLLLKSRLIQFARHEMPPRLAGLPATEVLKVLDDAVFDLLTEINGEFWKIAPEPALRNGAD